MTLTLILDKDLVCFPKQFQRLLEMTLTTNLKRVSIRSALITSIARVDAEGAVVTDPRNFTTKNVKKGKTDDVLFSKPSYVSTGKLTDKLKIWCRGSV